MFSFDNLQPLPALGRTWYLILPAGLKGKTLEKVIWNLQSYLEKGIKIRVLFDKNLEDVDGQKVKMESLKLPSLDSENSILYDSNQESELIESFQSLQEILPNLKFKIYPTNFFGLKKSQINHKIQQISEINWQNYQDLGFVYQKVDFDGDNWSVVQDFFLTSFGSDFQKIDGKLILTANPQAQRDIARQLPESMKNDQNQVFLVWQKVDIEGDSSINEQLIFQDSVISNPKDHLENLSHKKLVGAFSFLRIGGEIQLHYTAGKTTLENNFKGKKLPILTASMLHLWQNNPDYQNFELLTFSNKDDIVSQEYLKVGFEPMPERQCFLLQNKA